MKFNDTSRYKDIMNIEGFEPKHPRMERCKRAAQFAPFSALTGYEAAIEETAREVDQRPLVAEDLKEKISFNLNQIKTQVAGSCRARIVYFKEDGLKEGGHIIEVRSLVKKIREYERDLVIEGDRLILIDDLLDLEIINP